MSANANCIGIVVNRVATARRIWKGLTKKHHAVLLTGRMRPYDRELLLAEILPKIRAGRDRRVLVKPLFIVATQTIEVGADLDFDALVTEAASLSALRQRFGRLDRLGELGETEAVILYRPPKGAQEDYVYGASYSSTWRWLQSVASSEERVNFGFSSLDALCRTSPPPATSFEGAPILLPTHMELLGQTGLDAPQIDISAWLHGATGPSADVSLVWRMDLEENSPEHWIRAIELVPPSTVEALQVPLYGVRAWLTGRRPADITDVEGLSLSISNDNKIEGKQVIRWRGANEAKLITAKEIRPGDTLIVPSYYGGCDAYGWHPEGEGEVEDLAEHCQRSLNGPVSIRLTDSLSKWLGKNQALVMDKVKTYREALTEVDFDDGHEDRISTAEAELREVLGKVEVEFLGTDYSIEWHPQGVVLRSRTMDEIRGFITAGVAVELDSHCRGVEAQADQLATTHPYRKQICRAARIHDVGKSEARFQQLLHGDPVSAAQGPLLAKSGLRRLEDLRASYRDSKVPKGFRHELASLSLTKETDPLVRHLVGTHHGYGRPWFPACGDPETEGAALSDLRQHWAAQFARQRIEFSPWQLAAMEMLLRVADVRQSIQEQEEHAHV